VLRAMMRKAIPAATGLIATAETYGQKTGPALTIHWDQTEMVSRSTATLQVVVNTPPRPGKPLGEAASRRRRSIMRSGCATLKNTCLSVYAAIQILLRFDAAERHDASR
jgi:hypothetical protein